VKHSSRVHLAFPFSLFSVSRSSDSAAHRTAAPPDPVSPEQDGCCKLQSWDLCFARCRPYLERVRLAAFHRLLPAPNSPRRGNFFGVSHTRVVNLPDRFILLAICRAFASSTPSDGLAGFAFANSPRVGFFHFPARGFFSVMPAPKLQR
jgi:hypothetical protein